MLFILLSTACANVYTDPTAGREIASHKLIAILPPAVTIQPTKKMTAEMVESQQRLESQNFHGEIVSWLLKRKSQGKMRVGVMGYEETVALLERGGYYTGPRMTPVELAKALGVDAVIASNFAMAKPMSTGAAIASQILIGYSNTNQIAANLTLYSAEDGKQLWSYNHSIAGGLGSTSGTVTDQLMRNASKKLPYFIRR